MQGLQELLNIESTDNEDIASQSLYEVDATINICTEEIWRSSNGTTLLSCDPCAFQGAWRDSSAQQSVIGKQQALAYCKQHNIRYNLKPLLAKFKFVDDEFLRRIIRS